MKIFLSIILLAIISLSKAAQTNLRLLRSIPNRQHRGTPYIIQIIVPSIFDSIILRGIYIYFKQDEDAWDTLMLKLQISEEVACQYCTTVNNFSYDNCKAYIEKLIIYLESEK